MTQVSRISIVLAKWCPHCNPLSLENAKKMSDYLQVPLRVLDIDSPSESGQADALVRDFGDNSEGYIIPQVFVEYSNDTVQHIFSGFSEGTVVTKRRWEDLFSSPYYASLKKGGS